MPKAVDEVGSSSSDSDDSCVTSVPAGENVKETL